MSVTIFKSEAFAADKKHQRKQKLFNITALALATGLSIGHILTAASLVPRSVYLTYYSNTSEVPAKLQHVVTALSNESLAPLAKADLLKYVIQCCVYHDNSELLRQCVQRLADYYKK